MLVGALILVGQMSPTMQVVAVLVAAVVAAGLTFAVVKFLDRLRKVDAESAALQITEKAEREAAWFTPDEAAIRVDEEGLADILRHLPDKLPDGPIRPTASSVPLLPPAG